MVDRFLEIKRQNWKKTSRSQKKLPFDAKNTVLPVHKPLCNKKKGNFSQNLKKYFTNVSSPSRPAKFIPLLIIFYSALSCPQPAKKPAVVLLDTTVAAKRIAAGKFLVRTKKSA